MPVVSVNQFAILLLSLSTIAAMQSTTRASIVKFDYTGHVVDVIFFDGATDDFGFAAGQPISGSFVYDESIPDEDVSPIVGFFPNSILSFSFGSIVANPDDVNYSSFAIDAAPSHDQISGYLNSLYSNISDVFQVSLNEESSTEVLGSDLVDLTTLTLADFDVTDSRFSLLRTVKIDTESRTTLILASFDTLQISRVVPELASFVVWSVLGLVVGSVGHRDTR